MQPIGTTPNVIASPSIKGLYYEMLATRANESVVVSTTYTLSQAEFSKALRNAFNNPQIQLVTVNVNDYSIGVQQTAHFDIMQGMVYRETSRLSQEDYEAYALQLPSLVG